MCKSQGQLSSSYVVNLLSVLEQKWLENHEIYFIGAAELPLRFTHCAPLGSIG